MIRIRKSFEYSCFWLLLIVYFLSMQLRPVFSPDEVLCAEIVREMIQSGDWFSMQLNSGIIAPGILPGLQLNALFAKCFSVNPFFLRLVSFGAVCCCAWLFYYFFRINKFSRLTAQFASCVFLTMPAVFFYGCSVMPDILFALMTVLVYGVLIACQKKYILIPPMCVYLICGLLAGVACCLKDFSGLFIPLIAFELYLLTEKRKKDLVLFPCIMMIECLIILLLWNMLNPHVEYVHLLTDLTAEHTRFSFHLCPPIRLLKLIGGVLFWLPFFIVSCIALGKRLWQNTLWRLMIIFLAVVLLHFLFVDSSAAAILLIVFPVTVLTAAGMRNWLVLSWGKRFFRIFTISVMILDLCLVALVFAGFFTGVDSLHWFRKEEAWLWLLTIVGLSFSAVCMVFLLDEKRLWQKVRYILFALLPFILLFPVLYPRSLTAAIAPSSGLNKLPFIPRETMICTVSDLLPDVCWGLKRNDIVLLDSGDPAAEWKRRLGDEKFGAVLVILKTTDFEKGRRAGIFPRDPVWQKNWIHRCIPCKIVMYQYNTRDLKR